MHRGMGFDNNTSVFVVAGNIYKAEKYMAPLKKMFLLLETKDTLATPIELAPFKGHLTFDQSNHQPILIAQRAISVSCVPYQLASVCGVVDNSCTCLAAITRHESPE